MLYIKLNGITNAATLLQIFCPPESHPLTQGIGSKGQLSSFPEFHVAYQIKGNQVCSNMAAFFFPADPHPPPSPWGIGSKGQISSFSEHRHVTFQIKGNWVYSSQLPLPPQSWEIALICSDLHVP